MLLVAASCAGMPGLDSGGTARARGRPACDDPEIERQILELANTHPDLSPPIPGTAVAIDGIVETRAREIPDIGTGTFERLCIGTMELGSGEMVDIGWDIFTTDTILGPTYGLRPCFGPYDRTGRDCSAYAEGRVPGELVATATADS